MPLFFLTIQSLTPEIGLGRLLCWAWEPLVQITGANYLYGKRIKAQHLIATADPIFRYLLWPVLFGLELGSSFSGFPSSPLGSETSWGKWGRAGIGAVGKGMSCLQGRVFSGDSFPWQPFSQGCKIHLQLLPHALVAILFLNVFF